jgi:hypothetical protein
MQCVGSNKQQQQHLRVPGCSSGCVTVEIQVDLAGGAGAGMKGESLRLADDTVSLLWLLAGDTGA